MLLVQTAPKLALTKTVHVKESRHAPAAITALPLTIPIPKLKTSSHQLSRAHYDSIRSDFDQDFDGGSIIYSSGSGSSTKSKRSIKTFLKVTTKRRSSQNRRPSPTKQGAFQNPYSKAKHGTVDAAKDTEVDLFPEEPGIDPFLQPPSQQNVEPTPLPFIPPPIKDLPAYRWRSIVHPRAIICYAITDCRLKLNCRLEGPLSERLHRTNTLRHLSDAKIEFCELKEPCANKELAPIHDVISKLYPKVPFKGSIQSRRQDIRTRGPSQLRQNWTLMDFKEQQVEDLGIEDASQRSLQLAVALESVDKEELVIVPSKRAGQKPDHLEETRTWTAIKAYGRARSIEINQRQTAFEDRRHSLPLHIRPLNKSMEEGSLEKCLHALRLGNGFEEVAIRSVRRHSK